MSVQPLFTELSFYLLLLLLILSAVFFVCKSLIQRTSVLLLFTATIAIGVSDIVEKLDFAKFDDYQQQQVMEKVSNIRSRLESQIRTNLGISQSLVIYLKSKNFQITTEEFNTISQSILENDPRISHLALAKDLIINFIYPYQKNNKAIGLDYRNNIAQWPPIERAIQSGEIVLAGPVMLVQGGVAFIGRIPIYYSNEPNSDPENLWGLLSVVINMEKMFKSAGLETDNELTVALRGMDANGASGDAFYGDRKLFLQRAVLQTINLPVGGWQIAVRPKAGWAQQSNNLINIRLSIFAFYLLIVMIIIFRSNQQYKEAIINQQLRQEISERKSLEVEQKELNKQLHHAQKLKAIGQLTGGIAHDFNNILAAINGYTQLSKTIIDSKKDINRVSHYLSEVIKAGNRAKLLVQQMLVFSRGDNIEAQIMSPFVITKETILMLESTIPSSIKLTSHYENSRCEIKSDPIQFQQVILNLIVNSRDSIKNQIGEINISMKKVHIKDKICSSCNEKFSAEYLQVSISDNGKGISKKHIEQVFEPFYSTKEVGKGSGMGLSVVHGIVHAANGHIILKSKVDVGTKIRLFFPITQGTKTTIKKVAEPKKVQLKNTSGHILIVDDEPSITTLLDGIITEMQMTTTLFNDPVAAWNYYQKHVAEITMIMTDQTMPVMTGAELIQNVRGINSDVPIILCTGYSDIVDAEKAKLLQINCFLQKPFDIEVLSNKIHELHQS